MTDARPLSPAPPWRAHHIEAIPNGYGHVVHYCHVCGRMGASLAPMLPCPGAPDPTHNAPSQSASGG